jgi:hypothetical protein
MQLQLYLGCLLACRQLPEAAGGKQHQELSWKTGQYKNNQQGLFCHATNQEKLQLSIACPRHGHESGRQMVTLACWLIAPSAQEFKAMRNKYSLVLSLHLLLAYKP